MNNKNRPEIRFAGFTDDWEERKLGEISKTTIGEFVIKTKQSDESPYPVYNGGRSYTGKYDEYNNDGPKIVISARGANAGFVNYVSGRYWAGNSCYSVSVIKEDEFSIGYLYQFIKYNQVLFTAYQQAANIPSVSKSDVEKFSIKYPTVLEQQKIGSFFKQLDDAIALHQRKLDLLKEQKKGFLQKMFPKNGEAVPEIRFDGFTDDWEQRKLSEGTSKIGDGLHGTPQYTDDGTVFFINGNNLVDGKIVITKETKLVTELDQSKDDKLLNNDTILMSINGTIGNLAWYNNEKLMLGKSAAYLTISEFDKKFIYSYLQTSTVKSYFSNNLTGTTIKNLGLKTIRNTNLFVPIIEEQQKIGQFFKKLDDTIALHQRKLELLKEMKKGFLQKMLV